MKSVILPLFMALAIVSCQTVEIDEPRYLIAATEGFNQTRTSLGEDNRVLWSAEDMIAVFADRETPDRYQVTPESVGKSSADFYLMEESRSRVRIGANIGVYPYTTGITCITESAGQYILEGISVPSVQQYAENSFANKAFPMTAVSGTGTTSLAFKNVCGVLKLNLKGTSVIKSVSVKGNGEELLAGSAKVTVGLNNTIPSVEMDVEAGKEILLDCGDGVQLSEDQATAFLLSLPPTEFSRGFTVKVTSADGGEMTLRTDKPNPVRRSAILSMPEVEYDPFYVPVPSVDIKAVSVGFDDIVIRVDVNNVGQYSGGYKLKENFVLSNIVRDANWKIAPRITDRFSFEGPLTSFPTGTVGPSVSAGQTYVVWVAPYAESVTNVTAADIVYKEFTVPEVQDGGSVDVSPVDYVAELKSMEVTLSAPGASVMYAMLLTQNEYLGLNSDKAMVEYLMKNSTPGAGSEMTVKRTGLKPGERVHLLALAVDEDGRYGAILNKIYTTAVPVFNDDIAIDLDVTYEGKTAKVKVTSSGADIAGYYYFHGKTSTSSWTRILGGTRESAEEYLAVHNDSYIISNTKDKPFVNGNIEMTGLEMDVEHVVIVMAYDVNGRLSRASMEKFTPKLDLGDFVYKTGTSKELWKQSQPTVTFGDCFESGEFYMINWAVTPAEGMTAYAVCAHPNSLEGYSDPKAQAIRIYNLGDVVEPGKMINMIYGDKGNQVYVIWKDQDGNFYEAYSIAVPQN